MTLEGDNNIEENHLTFVKKKYQKIPLKRPASQAQVQKVTTVTMKLFNANRCTD